MKMLDKKKANNRRSVVPFSVCLGAGLETQRLGSRTLRKCYLIKYEMLLYLQMNACHLQMNHHTCVCI